MSSYKGIRTKNGTLVTFNDFTLDLRLDLKNHSPMGFEWGYNGSGPRQLALAILTKLMSDELALKYYEEFCKVFIESITDDEWEINAINIRQWLKENVTFPKPILTPRFKLSSHDDKNFDMFLDDRKLGIGQDLYDGYNMNISWDENTVFCDFSEIGNLITEDLPLNVFFNFIECSNIPYNKNFVVENLRLHGLTKKIDRLELHFWYSLELESFMGEENPILLMRNYSSTLKALTNVNLEVNCIEDAVYLLEFSLLSKNSAQTLENILSDEIIMLTELQTKIFNNKKKDVFEATFEIPKEYRGTVKQYLMYFEEFLSDLSIQAEVEIEQHVLDTVLKVTPMNKDEALEKILQALQVYISVPVISKQINTNEMIENKVVISKLQAQCMHLESQLMLKDVTIAQQNIMIESKNIMIEDTNDIFYKAGFELETITKNKTLLIDSLKKVSLEGKNVDKKTFFSSFRAVISVLGNKFEIEMKKEKL